MGDEAKTSVCVHSTSASVSTGSRYLFSGLGFNRRFGSVWVKIPQKPDQRMSWQVVTQTAHGTMSVSPGSNRITVPTFRFQPLCLQ
jgi:hypothetical protein